MHTLELDRVSSGYSGKEVFHDIGLKITEPSIYVVVGSNGAGKTTLFRSYLQAALALAGRLVKREKLLP
jgi:ABC-type cobalamin/Fe3+-siderophores transport system ATPase subunit